MNHLHHFFVSSATQWTGYDDSSPVVYGSYAMLVCLDPHCRYVQEITDDLNLRDVAEMAERHWTHAHALKGRDF